MLLGPERDPAQPPAPPALVERVTAAFERGSACGLLHLGAADLDADLDPALALWRQLSRPLVAAGCAALDPTDPAARALRRADPAALSALVTAAPPMRGAGLLTAESLAVGRDRRGRVRARCRA